MEGWLGVFAGQALEHQARHAEVDPRVTGRGQKFVVAAQAPIAPDLPDLPERALDDPVVRRGLEAGQPGGWGDSRSARIQPLRPPDRSATYKRHPHVSQMRVRSGPL